MKTLSEYQQQFDINPEAINISIWILAQERGYTDLKQITDLKPKNKTVEITLSATPSENIDFSAFSERQKNYTFDNYNRPLEAQRKAWQLIRDNKDKSFIFMGNVGTGKTHLACAVARKYLMADKKICVTNSFDMIGNCLRDFLQGDAIEYYKSVDFLVVDEFDKIMKNTENAMTVFFNIVNYFYENNKNLILITNSKMEDLFKTFGERNAAALFDRLNEMGMIIDFNWESYRETKKQEVK